MNEQPPHANGEMAAAERPQNPAPPVPAPDPLPELLARVDELRLAWQDSLYATMDTIRIRVRDALLSVLLKALAGVLLAAWLIGGIAILLIGASGGIAALFKSPLWAGYLITGMTLLVSTGIALRWAFVRMRSQRLAEAKERYESRNARQNQQPSSTTAH